MKEITMRFRRSAWAASAVFAAGLAFAMPQVAHANPAGVGIVQNTKGEAGYFANDNGHTRFRDIQAQVGVTNQIKNLDGANNNLGGVGVELCDPNTGYSAQLGVQWTGNRFQVQYGHGVLGNTNFADPCIQSGLITNPTPLSPLALNPVTGDQLSFEIYYNPTSHWITVNSCDLTQDVCRQAHFNDGFKNLYEFGVGAVTQQPTLTAPANNFLASFSHLAANYYSSTHFWGSIFVPAHWNLKQADWINGSSQVIMSSNGSLDSGGHMFSLFNGSTSV
jgi:hypothetical protein